MTTDTNEAPVKADAARLDPLSKGVAYTAVTLLAGLAAASFTIAFPGLVWVGAQAGMNHVGQVLLPIAVDAALLVMALTTVVARARREPSRWLSAVVAVLVLASSAAQISHTMETTTAVPGSVSWWTATCIAAGVPMILLASLEAATQLAIAPPSERRRRRTVTPVQPAGKTPPAAPRPAQKRPTPTASTTSADMRKNVLQLAAQGNLSTRAIAEQTGASKSTVSRILASTSGSRASESTLV